MKGQRWDCVHIKDEEILTGLCSAYSVPVPPCLLTPPSLPASSPLHPSLPPHPSIPPCLLTPPSALPSLISLKYFYDQEAATDTSPSPGNQTISHGIKRGLESLCCANVQRETTCVCVCVCVQCTMCKTERQNRTPPSSPITRSINRTRGFNRWRTAERDRQNMQVHDQQWYRYGRHPSMTHNQHHSCVLHQSISDIQRWVIQPGWRSVLPRLTARPIENWWPALNYSMLPGGWLINFNLAMLQEQSTTFPWLVNIN